MTQKRPVFGPVSHWSNENEGLQDIFSAFDVLSFLVLQSINEYSFNNQVIWFEE